MTGCAAFLERRRARACVAIHCFDQATEYFGRGFEKRLSLGLINLGYALAHMLRQLLQAKLQLHGMVTRVVLVGCKAPLTAHCVAAN